MTSSTSTAALSCSNRQSLAAIHQADFQIGIWERALPAELSAEAERLAYTDWEGLRFSSLLSELPAALSALPLSADFRAEVRDLAVWFAELSGSAQLRLFFGRVQNDMCRRFHTDIVSLRLLCTYVGPGTLWVDPAVVVTKHLARGSNEQMIADPTGIHQVPTGQVCLLKGALHEHSKHGAVLHRSPPVEDSGQARLVLRIDTPTSLF
jgi:hypothetical protein